MKTTTITQEFISRIDDEMRYNASRYYKEGEPHNAWLQRGA